MGKNTAGYGLFPSSGAGAFTTSCVQINGPVRDGDAEGGANSPRHQADFATVRTNQLRGDGQAQAGSAGARTLKCLEQMCASLLSYARPGIRHLDDHDAAF